MEIGNANKIDIFCGDAWKLWYRLGMAKKFELEWLFEPFQEHLSFEARYMFGCRSAYLDGKIVMVLAENSEDKQWNGVLFPCERDQHEAVLKDYPDLVPHSILPKWLYLSLDNEAFEQIAMEISELIGEMDSRFGSIPKERPRRKAKKKKAKRKSATKR